MNQQSEPMPARSRVPLLHITQRQAISLGYSRREIRLGYTIAEAVMSAHGVGSPASLTSTARTTAMAGALTNGDMRIHRGAKRVLDPAIVRQQNSLLAAREAIQYLESAFRAKLILVEDDKTAYTAEEARAECLHLDRVIAQDRAVGLRHHEHCGMALHACAAILPPLDLVAATGFIASSLNVDLWNPQANLSAWLTAVAVGSLLVAAQLVTAVRAGDAANSVRQAQAETRIHDVEHARGRRLRYLVATGGFTTLLIALLVYRVELIASYGNGAFGVLVLTALAAGAAVAAPLLKFLAHAVDGSTHSRRRDRLNRAIAKWEQRWETAESAACDALGDFHAAVDMFETKLLQQVLAGARMALDAGHRVLRLVHLLLGIAESSGSHTTPDIYRAGSGVDGVRDPDHVPLLSRIAWVAKQVEAAKDLGRRLAHITNSRAVAKI
jgi:hypothetical protein